MKTFNIIFSAIFAIIAMTGLYAIIFCDAVHQIPFTIGSALFSLMLFLDRNEETDKNNKYER